MLYPNEQVRLTRDLPDHELRTGDQGTIESTIRDEDNNFLGVNARFYRQSSSTIASIPLDALELVISPNLQHRTAVFWDISLPAQKLLETAMHSILDCGFVMREGLNLAQLLYDQGERWWKWGERFNDPAGAQAVVSGPLWDGAVIAFSGRQRYQLEFRLKSRRGPCLLLHEREKTYAEQVRDSGPATSLSRVLVNLQFAVGAQFCAFPVADPWLMDEDWPTLLRAPYYPDFFVVPENSPPGDLPDSFRAARLTGNRLMMTDLPVKFSPVEDPLQRSEEQLRLDSLRKCYSLGEKYYDQMYETRFNVNGLYSNVKDAFIDAIAIANQLGMKHEAENLSSRLDHIKAVFRSQFS